MPLNHKNLNWFEIERKCWLKIMKIIKLFIFSSILLVMAIQVFAKCKTENCGLLVHGKVVDSTIDRNVKDYVDFVVNLEIEFKNESDESILLFKPYIQSHGMRYWLGGKTISINRDDKPIYIIGQWESVIGSPFYRQLAENLDTKNPSDKYTKFLQPNETWKFEDSTFIRFSEKKEKYSSFSDNKSWEEMQELPSKLWLTVSYELNPWNVEYFKPKLIRKLRKRWKGFGNVLIEKDRDSRFSHFTISSESMEIDFSEAKEKRTEAN